MKKIILLAMLLSFNANADDSLAQQLIENAYVKVGLGLKFNEAEVRWDGGATNHPVSARFEVATSYKNFTFGYSHHSQLTSGAPFNNNKEYFKDEFFVDYKIKLSEVF